MRKQNVAREEFPPVTLQEFPHHLFANCKKWRVLLFGASTCTQWCTEYSVPREMDRAPIISDTNQRRVLYGVRDSYCISRCQLQGVESLSAAGCRICRLQGVESVSYTVQNLSLSQLQGVSLSSRVGNPLSVSVARYRNHSCGVRISPCQLSLLEQTQEGAHGGLVLVHPHLRK